MGPMSPYNMQIQQNIIRLSPKNRGFHIITDEITNALSEFSKIHIGICQLFIQHTSASLAINENADPTVRHDLESHFNNMVPEGQPYYRHTSEGPDDMPAHIKAVLTGTSVTIPIRDGKPALGTWQGIYLCEHRNRGGSRSIVITAWGE